MGQGGERQQRKKLSVLPPRPLALGAFDLHLFKKRYPAFLLAQWARGDHFPARDDGHLNVCVQHGERQF